MREAATLMLKSGNFQEYCEIQMQIGNYDTAIAVAPKVSLKYWQTCIKQHIQHIDSTPSNQDTECDKISYLLLLGKVDEAALLMHHRGETQDAKVAKALKG